MPSTWPFRGDISSSGGSAVLDVVGKMPAPWLTLRPGVMGLSPFVMGLLSGLLGGPADFPLGTPVKYPSSAAPNLLVFSLTASPDLLSPSTALRLLALRRDFILNAILFALGALSLPLALFGTLSMLPSFPPMPSLTLPFKPPFMPGVCGHPPGKLSTAGVGISDDLRPSSFDVRLFVMVCVVVVVVLVVSVGPSPLLLWAKVAGMSLDWRTMKKWPA